MKDLLKQLIQADSTLSKGELAAAEVVAAWFRKHGIDCAVDHWDAGRGNVVAHIRGGGRRPALMVVCHLDVVGPGDETWRHPPFDATEENGRIYGRGATDMKGGIAAVVTAICETVASGTALQGDIIFAATAGEETDSAGVHRFMQDFGHRTEDGRQGKQNEGHSPASSALSPLAGIIIPEPTDLAVVTAHRGLFWLKVTTLGKAVHSSMPQWGINAILAMKRVLDELEQYRIPCEPHPRLGGCSLSINTIAGGKAMNVVPDRCTLGVDIRTLPGQSHDLIRNDLEQILARLRTRVPQFEGELAVERSVPAMETDPDCAFVKTFCSAVNVDLTNVVGFTTDAPYLLPLGAPIVIYGPGRPNMCHQVDEYLEIADLQRAADSFKRVMHTFLA